MSHFWFWPAVVMGAIEGLTEFLPISSTGHLIITGDLIDLRGEKAKTFQIFIQLGAILAVCWYYRDRLLGVVAGLPGDEVARRFTVNLAVAFFPAAALGFLSYGYIRDHLFSPGSVALASIIGGFVILIVERWKGEAHIHSVDELRWQDALKVGIAQLAALIPGTSRSGATIIGGLVFGLSRPAATELSFFLAIPTIFAAVLYDLWQSWPLLAVEDLKMFAVGFAVSFFTAWLAVSALLRFVRTHSFRPFAYYRIVFGGLALAYFWS
ncbi:MAG: undecaprenyl-diphosphate phosphatase [Gammaproteobacteria bacterium]